jgi:hypothetical protein
LQIRHRAHHWRLDLRRWRYRRGDQLRRLGRRLLRVVARTVWLDMAGLAALVWAAWVVHQGPAALGVALLVLSYRLDQER